jgi:hydroxymethylpyrimidine pyrophosphatase-like HAD family hydrolase
MTVAKAAVRYHVLATDYDGTLAERGQVDEPTIAALERVRRSGRKLVLVTGRVLEDLCTVFPRLDLFDVVVAENGALVYRPATRESRVLGEAPPPEFVTALRAHGVAPLSTGRVIVATWEPHEERVLEVIRSLGLELQVIFNKGAVMVLPSGINKAVGLTAALDDLYLSLHNAVGIGDAENDHAFLTACECSVAVANALPSLKERCDFVTAGDHGRGVQELVAELVDPDLHERAAALVRHDLVVGERADGSPVRLPPYGGPVLVAGPSGGGKSTFATAFLEQLASQGYQFCIVDPEGDYHELEIATVLGDAGRAPGIDEALELLRRPSQSCVLNLLGIPLPDRPRFFDTLLPRLQEMRAHTGRPHWIFVDEAHHLLPAQRRPSPLTLPRELVSLLLVTVHPERIAPELLPAVTMVAAVGPSPEDTFRRFAETAGIEPPPAFVAEEGQAVLWCRTTTGPPIPFAVRASRVERLRHVRKYAVGELGPDKSFYFRGREGRLNLRAQNLQTFVQMADGVDDDTWRHHLARGDYSRWMREAIKDDALADEVAAVERERSPDASATRARIRSAIEQRYTAAS